MIESFFITGLVYNNGSSINYLFMILLLALLLHITLILIRGYFLSVEFTLYPYLTAHGFLPYRDIIDQHFPTLLFGPFSLPTFLTANPWPLLAVFLFVLCLTDILFYASLVRYKVARPAIWLVLYLLSSVYFSGNVLWLETFINLLLTLWFFLSFSKLSSAKFVSGLLVSQILLLRPTIFPAIVFLVLGLSLSVTPLFLVGLFIGLLLPGIYLVRYNLVSDFYRLAIDFNQHIYPREAFLLPVKRQIIYLLFWLSPTVYFLLKKKRILLLISLTFLFFLIFPRFGFEHLQPLFLCATLFWALSSPKQKMLIYFFIFALFVLSLISSIRHPYGNYFLNPETENVSAIVKALPGQDIYLLGASDLIYPLSGKLPPHFTYLPSLPWYFSQKDFRDRVIDSLSDKNTPVLVDYNAEVDGSNVLDSSNEVFKYIRMNFAPGEKIGHYQIFIPIK